MKIEQFIRDFKLQEKFFMDGELNGSILLKGKGTDVQVVDGNFTASPKGGMLIIKDARFLENIARRADQPLDLLVESFRNYHYNTGIISLSLKEDDLILGMALDGETGKRDLNITLHDFTLIKGGP